MSQGVDSHIVSPSPWTFAPGGSVATRMVAVGLGAGAGREGVATGGASAAGAGGLQRRPRARSATIATPTMSTTAPAAIGSPLPPLGGGACNRSRSMGDIPDLQETCTD